MQAFSYLRRSRFNLQPLLILLLFAAAIIYETVGSVYLFLTPLLGVGFFFWRRHYEEKRYYFPIALFFLYTLYFEIDRDLILFSFILTSIFYHYWLAGWIEHTINSILVIDLINVVWAYGGYYLFNLFLAFIFNLPLPAFDQHYLLYAITDFVIVVLLS